MNKIIYILPVFLLTFHLALSQNEDGSSRFVVSTGLPFVENKEPLLNIQVADLEPGEGTESNIRITTYYFDGESLNDSLLLYKTFLEKVSIGNAPVQKTIRLADNEEQEGFYIHASYKDQLLKTNLNQPGTYHVHIQIENEDQTTHRTIFIFKDSLIDPGSGLAAELFQQLNKKTEGDKILRIKAKTYLQSQRKLLEKISGQYGMTCIIPGGESAQYVDFFYNEGFMGRMPLLEGQTLGDFLSFQNDIQDRLELQSLSMKTEDLSAASLVGQFRELAGNDDDEKILTGNIRLSSFMNSDYDEYSQMDNQVYEVQGDLSLPVWGIPVQVSGLYTSQDKNRMAKSGYFNIKYDHDKAKEKTAKLIQGFREAFQQNKDRVCNYRMTYDGYIGNMESEKSRMIQQLGKEMGLRDMQSWTSGRELPDKDFLKEQLTEYVLKEYRHLPADSVKNLVETRYQQALAYYEKLEELNRMVEKYRNLKQQLTDKLLLDSLQVYAQIRDLEDVEQLTNKDMIRKASDLFPDGKAKSFLSGLTYLEAGIFSKYVSKYSLAGQRIKGLDIGYDVKYAVVGLTYGRAEYIDRNGVVEGYKTISARSQFKPVLNQQVSLEYTLITAEKDILQDERFQHLDITTIPGFLNPVNIFSLRHTGTIAGFISLNVDAAFSQEHKLEDNETLAHASFPDQTAVSADLMAAVPGTEYLVSLNYERVGKEFKNNSLPVSFSGIERMSARVDGTLFRSSVLFGAEYAYLVQNSMYTSGNQAKWGFNLKTNWKRLPNISFSYKPFTSVRSPYDTFNIPQKEMIGNLLSGRINYQYKGRNRDLFRATLMLTQSTSLMDSIRFQSSMLQVNFSYIHPVYSLMVALGANNMESDYYESAHPIYNQNQFVLLQGNYKLTEGLSVSMGSDVAKSKIGISKYGFNAASSYTFEKIPLSIRLSGRFSSFILEEFSPWKKIYSAGLDVSYRLFTKLD